MAEKAEGHDAAEEAKAETPEASQCGHHGHEAPDAKPAKADLERLAVTARAGLERLIACFDDPATAYPSVPRPLRAPRFNDYAHLARIKEWSLGGFAADPLS